MATLFNRVKSAGLDRLGFHVTVESVTEPTPGFMLITLVGAELKSKGWRPGDRVSVRTPDDNLRNYTPFDWDADAGRARLLVAGRANGPGTRFVGSLGIGDDVQLLGPKKSVNLDFALAPIIVGDETVLGLCAAWKFANPDRPATVLLEAADIGACHVAAHSVDVTIERAKRWPIGSPRLPRQDGGQGVLGREQNRFGMTARILSPHLDFADGGYVVY